MNGLTTEQPKNAENQNTTTQFLGQMQENNTVDQKAIILSDEYLNLPKLLGRNTKELTNGYRTGPLAVSDPNNPRRPEDQWPTPFHVAEFLQTILQLGSPTSANIIVRSCEKGIIHQLFESAQQEIANYNDYFEKHDKAITHSAKTEQMYNDEKKEYD